MTTNCTTEVRIPGGTEIWLNDIEFLDLFIVVWYKFGDVSKERAASIFRNVGIFITFYMTSYERTQNAACSTL